jgi:hypothetical protein
LGFNFYPPCGLALSAKSDFEPFRPLLWTLGGALLFVLIHAFVRWSVRPWYFQSAFVLTLPAVAIAVAGFNRYLIGFCAFLSLYFAGLPAFAPSYFRRIEKFPLMLEVIQTEVPATDRIGSFNCGYLQYFTDRRVVNLDGFVNNEILSYYKGYRGMEYLRSNHIKWLIDYELYITTIFGPYLGPKAESSLAVVGFVPDQKSTKNKILLLNVLPESFRPVEGRVITIWREWASRRQWGPFPWPSFTSD